MNQKQSNSKNSTPIWYKSKKTHSKSSQKSIQNPISLLCCFVNEQVYWEKSNQSNQPLIQNISDLSSPCFRPNAWRLKNYPSTITVQTPKYKVQKLSFFNIWKNFFSVLRINLSPFRPSLESRKWVGAYVPTLITLANDPQVPDYR